MNNTTKTLRIARPTTGNDGKIGALSMVKALMDSGCDMKGTPLAAQLTDAERAELGL
jgi:hypothetical protein